MSIERLEAIIAPPVVIFEGGRGEDWLKVEKQLGIELPIDYKVFIETYGTGRIDRFLWVLNPFSNQRNLNLFHELNAQTEDMKFSRQVGQEPRRVLFPQPSGLLPFAKTDNGNTAYWKVGGNSNSWSVVLSPGRGYAFEEFDETAIGFLIAILTREKISKMFPSDFPSAKPRFESLLDIIRE